MIIVPRVRARLPLLVVVDAPGPGVLGLSGMLAAFGMLAAPFKNREPVARGRATARPLTACTHREWARGVVVLVHDDGTRSMTYARGWAEAMTKGTVWRTGLLGQAGRSGSRSS